MFKQSSKPHVQDLCFTAKKKNPYGQSRKTNHTAIRFNSELMHIVCCVIAILAYIVSISSYNAIKTNKPLG